MRTMKDRSHDGKCSAARLLAVAGLIMIAGAKISVAGPESGDGHAAHAEAPAAEDVPRVAVTRQQVEQLGIKLAVAEKGNVDTLIRLPGEVVLNANTTAQISPRVTGIIDTVATDSSIRWRPTSVCGSMPAIRCSR